MSESPKVESDEESIGPRIEEASIVEPKRKKRRVLHHEDLYLSNLPSAEYYEKSYMHRDIVTHVVSSKTDFIITGSCDGHIKFWKKQEQGIEFVKHYRAHLGNVQHLCCSVSGRHLASISSDKSLKIFDVENFDMINMVHLQFIPKTCEWIHPTSDPEPLLAISDSDTSSIHIFAGLQADSTPLHTLATLHTQRVDIIKYNPTYDTVISVDKLGMIEYWSGRSKEYQNPTCVAFESKLDTDLFEFVKTGTHPKALAVSPNGQLIATIGSDKMIRVFKFLTGKLTRVYDETTQHLTSLQQKQQQIGNMEFGRRLAVEREVEKDGDTTVCNLLFDESGHFLIYATFLGIKIVNLITNRLARSIGKTENLRILSLALFQGKINEEKTIVTAEMAAATNPTLESSRADPTIIATAFKKNRFYMFSDRDSSDPKNTDTDRDVFNEKPSKEDIVASTDIGGGQRLYETAIVHTSLGDIQLKLFPKECPRSVENFCVHAKNGYYNGHLFHRCIKQFMIQTGDPMGTGVGGESIWGGEFEDELHPTLKHDRPYTLSMANAGPNTNGSQFFITVVPSPWLDNKHTVFGRVVRGLETVQSISNVKTNPKTNKPYDDINIVSISLK